jgi:hypothetical protein
MFCIVCVELILVSLLGISNPSQTSKPRRFISSLKAVYEFVRYQTSGIGNRRVSDGDFGTCDAESLLGLERLRRDRAGSTYQQTAGG